MGIGFSMLICYVFMFDKIGCGCMNVMCLIFIHCMTEEPRCFSNGCILSAVSGLVMMVEWQDSSEKHSVTVPSTEGH